MEAIIPLFPASWSGRVEQIVLYQGDTPLLRASFYPKQRNLGLFWPVPLESASKAEGVQELLLALSVVTECGELPDRLSPVMRERHETELADLAPLPHEGGAPCCLTGRSTRMPSGGPTVRFGPLRPSPANSGI